MTEGAIKTGGCLCGRLRYKISGPLKDAVVCHCSQCRRQAGSGWMSSECNDADLVITCGEGLAWHHASASAKRGFCRFCGSVMFWKGLGHGWISVSVGSLDGASGLKTAMHIYVADKGDSYEIADGLPQFEQGH